MNPNVVINNFPIYNVEQDENFSKKEQHKNRSERNLPGVKIFIIFVTLIFRP